MTLYPFIGALILSIKPWDHNLSKWARDKLPVFGSANKAGQASNEIRDILMYSALLTTLSTSTSNDSPLLLTKLKGFLVISAGYSLTYNVTDFGKTSVGRRRPNGSDTRSFPSIHSASSAALASIASNNIERTSFLDKSLVLPLQILHYSLAGGVAWARVESNNHYVTDVLSGIAVGNFITNFVYNSLFPTQVRPSLSLSIQPFIGTGAYLFNLSYVF
jgi:membrane-associated phospholipid phosphatase